MPVVPMEMPSETPTVLKRYPTKPAAVTDARTLVPRSSKCMLHGLPSNHTEQTPTCALLRSASVSPVAYSIA